MINISPADSGKLTHISSVPTKIVIWGLTILCITIIVWGFFGTVTDKEYLKGIVFPTEGIVGANIPKKGTVENIFVKKGDFVTKGQVLALVSVSGSHSVLSSPCDGVVLTFLPENFAFNGFEDIVDILPSDLSKQTARNLIAYANFTSKRFIKEGQIAQVTPSNEKRERVGYVNGRVKSVAQYPTSRKEAEIRLQNPSLVQEIFPDERSVFEIEIELDVDADNPDRLKWSFSNEEEIDMSVATFCNVEVITKSRSFFGYLMENVRQTSNKFRLWAGK